MFDWLSNMRPAQVLAVRSKDTMSSKLSTQDLQGQVLLASLRSLVKQSVSLQLDIARDLRNLEQVLWARDSQE